MNKKAARMKASKTREASNDKRVEDADGSVERVRSTCDIVTMGMCMFDGRRRSIMAPKSLDEGDVEEGEVDDGGDDETG